VIGGGSLAVSGISLLFPFQVSIFAGTFKVLNVLGTDFPTVLTPLQEAQYALLWHTIMGVVMIAIILAHIYIGSLGLEGAFAAMGTGQVDENWAREHHDLWYAKLGRGGGESGSAHGQAAE
jgi:formate dehydrogenase subunit gamma